MAGRRATCRPCTGGTPSSIVSTVTMPGRDAFAPALGRSASHSLPLSDANASFAALRSSTLEAHVRRARSRCAFSPDRHHRHVGDDQPQHGPRLAAVDRLAVGAERDHVEAGVDVDPVAGLDRVDQAVRRSRAARRRLADGRSAGRRASRLPRAKSAAVSWAPSKISRVATLSRSVAGSLIAPSSSWLSRIVVDRVEVLRRDDAPGRALRDRLLRDEHGHERALRLEAVAVAVQVRAGSTRRRAWRSAALRAASPSASTRAWLRVAWSSSFGSIASARGRRASAQSGSQTSFAGPMWVRRRVLDEVAGDVALRHGVRAGAGIAVPADDVEGAEVDHRHDVVAASRRSCRTA